MFFTLDFDLHTGFTWLGTGALAPRHLSSRFINQQTAAPELLTRDQSLVSDMFFSLWANSYPEQVGGSFHSFLVFLDKPNPVPKADAKRSRPDRRRRRGSRLVPRHRGRSVDSCLRQRCLSFPLTFSASLLPDPFRFFAPLQLDAVRKLYDILLVKDPYLCPDPFPLAAPPPESHTRAPCANDGCLFSTSMTPFPHPSILSYPSAPPPRPWWSPTRGKKPPVTMADVEHKFDPWKVASVREYEDKWAGVPGGWPSDKWWTEKGSWHLAVDGKGHLTCWESWRREFYLFSDVFFPLFAAFGC